MGDGSETKSPDDRAMDRYTVVLCRAEGAANVGACCRAMKAMGVTRLILASCPELDDTVVRTHALTAYDLYRSAERVGSLDEALAGADLAAGFSRRTGRRRKTALPVSRLAEDTVASAHAAIALVFGNERDGLSAEEMDACDLAVSIPSSPLFPSLNLSHAVQIACWELRRAVLAGGASSAGADAPTGYEKPAGRDACGSAAAAMAERLGEAGFFKIAGREDAERFMREIAARAALTEAELARLTGMLDKLVALDRHRRGNYS